MKAHNHLNSQRILRGMMALTIFFSGIGGLDLMAQAPFPQGPGPVIMENGQPVNPTQPGPGAAIPQGPGPVIMENGQPVNPTQPGPGAAIPQGPGPVTSVAPPGWAGIPGTLTVPPTADWMNQGTINVMATGIDSEGVTKQIPLFVSYNFNGVQYNVTVLNAWNPYTMTWDCNVDMPAYSTSYFFNGFTYNYYVMLSTGTFYFNL